MKSMLMARVLAVLLLWFMVAVSTWATDIRGRVMSQSFRGLWPRPYAVVVIYYNEPRIGGPQAFAQTQTGPDGFYYFYNLMPGQFWLQFNGGQLVPITVPNVPAYDLPPYTLYE